MSKLIAFGIFGILAGIVAALLYGAGSELRPAKYIDTRRIDDDDFYDFDDKNI